MNNIVLRDVPVKQKIKKIGNKMYHILWTYTFFITQNIKKHVNRDFYIASSPISQSSLFEKVCRLILASSQRKPWINRNFKI